jgi:hypothetical protein
MPAAAAGGDRSIRGARAERTHLPRSARSTVAEHLADECRASPSEGRSRICRCRVDLLRIKARRKRRAAGAGLTTYGRRPNPRRLAKRRTGFPRGLLRLPVRLVTRRFLVQGRRFGLVPLAARLSGQTVARQERLRRPYGIGKPTLDPRSPALGWQLSGGRGRCSG